VDNAADISIDARVGAVQASGSLAVFPIGTITYTLIAKSTGGNDSRSVTVEVVTPLPLPPQPTGTATIISGADLLGRDGQDVFFDYDKTEIRDDGRVVLTHDADVLKRILASNPNFTVALEGHCDERGSAEYNLGLGDRRASAAKDFLVQLGIPADRVRTISYGKERPFCTDASEACYQRNRRARLAPVQ
jgi:peptidoglycan-associated lipoprotein